MAYSPINYLEFLKLMDAFRPIHRGNAYAVCADLMMRTRRVSGFKDGIDLQRGQAIFGLHSMASATGISVQSIRTIISVLQKTSKATIESTSDGSLLTWLDYNGLAGQENENQQSNQQAINKRSTNDQQHKNSSKGSRRTETEKKAAYAALPQWAKDVLNNDWVKAGRPLTKAQSTTLSKITMVTAVVDLHEKDGHPVDEIPQVIHFVAASGFRGVSSPVKFRDKLKNDPTMTQYEFQLGMWESSKSNGKASQASPCPPDNMAGQEITYPNNPMVGIQDPIRRMAAILEKYPKATSDPDQGKDWTIPDSEFNA